MKQNIDTHTELVHLVSATQCSLYTITGDSGQPQGDVFSTCASEISIISIFPLSLTPFHFHLKTLHPTKMIHQQFPTNIQQPTILSNTSSKTNIGPPRNDGFIWFPSSESPFSKGPPFSGAMLVFGGIQFSISLGSFLLIPNSGVLLFPTQKNTKATKGKIPQNLIMHFGINFDPPKMG